MKFEIGGVNRFNRSHYRRIHTPKISNIYRIDGDECRREVKPKQHQCPRFTSYNETRHKNAQIERETLWNSDGRKSISIILLMNSKLVSLLLPLLLNFATRTSRIFNSLFMPFLRKKQHKIRWCFPHDAAATQSNKYM